MQQPRLLKPEPWGVHLLGLINPALAIGGNLLGGAYTLAGLVFVWLICPLLDLLLGQSKAQRQSPTRAGPYVAILWAHGLLHFVVLGSYVHLLVANGVDAWLLAATASSGLAAATSAIVTAHELGHRRRYSPGWWLARAMLLSIHYPHFTTEHNHTHHRQVGTAADATSATLEQSLWAFWPSTIARQWLSAYQLHQRKGLRGVRNPTLHGLALQFGALLALWLAHLGGQVWAAPLALGWIGLSLLAVLTLEYVNYIRHWGLRRQDGQNRFQEGHAWNTEARWSRWSLLELTRHSDHHLHAARPFWKLQAHPAAPQLPFGYYACWWPCLLPTIWRRLMAGRAPGV